MAFFTPGQRLFLTPLFCEKMGGESLHQTAGITELFLLKTHVWSDMGLKWHWKLAEAHKKHIIELTRVYLDFWGYKLWFPCALMFILCLSCIIPNFLSVGKTFPAWFGRFKSFTSAHNVKYSWRWRQPVQIPFTYGSCFRLHVAFEGELNANDGQE